MAEPDIAIRKFIGLNTHSPNAEGDISELIVAENVQWDQDGIAKARTGFNFFTNLPAGQVSMINAGRLASTADESVDGRLFIGTANYYEWTGAKTDPSLPATGVAGTLPDNFSDKGAQHGNALYLVDGARWNGTTLTVSSLGYPILGTPKGAIASHQERLWVAATSSGTCRLYFSEVGDATTWPAANFIDVGVGYGGEIVDLRSFQNRLWIFKTGSIWVLETPGVPTSWILRKFSDDGCAGQSSLEYEGSMYWVSADGAYRYNGSTVERISDPIKDVFIQRINPFDRCNSAAFRDNFVFFIEVEGVIRVLCFQTKLGLWSEWVFEFSDANTFVESIWSEPYGPTSGAGFEPGLYLGIHDGGSTGMIIGNDFDVTSNEYMDQLGTRISTDVVTNYPYSAVIQTKFSDLDDPSMKRVTYWQVEYEGADITFEQISDSGASVSRTDDNPGLTADAGVTYSTKFKGIGYFRRISLKITLSNLNNALDSIGARVYGVFGYVKSKGKQIKTKDQVMN